MENSDADSGPGTPDAADAKHGDVRLARLASTSDMLGQDSEQGRTAPPEDLSPRFSVSLSPTVGPPVPPDPRPAAVSWKDLPRKQQLIVITLSRLSEPLVQTSIQSYMFYQLKWFDPTLPDSVISGQAGLLQCV
jgi:hypothetical protein